MGSLRTNPTGKCEKKILHLPSISVAAILCIIKEAKENYTAHRFRITLLNREIFKTCNILKKHIKVIEMWVQEKYGIPIKISKSHELWVIAKKKLYIRCELKNIDNDLRNRGYTTIKVECQKERLDIFM